MNNTKNDVFDKEGIFIGKPSKQDLINYFMKQQRIATIKKMEETERENSPDLSESFEIYLEQKRKKIQVEKNKLEDFQAKKRESAETFGVNSKSETVVNELSFHDDSFTELEKMCENTLNLSNVSEILADLTTLEIKTDKNGDEVQNVDPAEETKLQEVSQPSFLLDNSSILSNDENSNFKTDFGNSFSTVLGATTMSLSFKTTHSIQSGMSTDKSEHFRTANDKSFELTKSNQSEQLINLSDDTVNNDPSSLSFETENKEQKEHSINDTLDEIDFLLSQAQKLNDKKEIKSDVEQKTKAGFSSSKNLNSPRSANKKKIIHTPKSSPLITFSPLVENKSPLINFKQPKPVSSSKNPQFIKINNKKFQHIVSPVSRYIQTSESVLNANAHVNYKGTAKRHFNFRDSENFDKSHDISVKVSSLPLRAKTKDLNTQVSNENNIRVSSPSVAKKGNIKQQRNENIFFDNTFNDSKI